MDCIVNRRTSEVEWNAVGSLVSVRHTHVFENSSSKHTNPHPSAVGFISEGRFQRAWGNLGLMP